MHQSDDNFNIIILSINIAILQLVKVGLDFIY